jgi:LemA protein
VLIFYAIGLYNNFVSLAARIKAAIQEIGNQLKRQSELIPNLEASAKGYLKHEKDIVKMLTDARKTIDEAIDSGDIQNMSDAGDKIAKLLPRIQVAVESNPEIKGAQVITQLMEELRDTSDKVMYARRTLVDLTADYNIKIATFPSNIVASIFGFKTEPGLKMADSGSSLEVSAEETKTPKVSI